MQYLVTKKILIQADSEDEALKKLALEETGTADLSKDSEVDILDVSIVEIPSVPIRKAS